jgi:iron-sulfur cluster assembly accessory protein
MLTLTEAARSKLSEVLSGQAEPVYGLRVSIQPSGCCGHQYALSLATAAETGDWVGEFNGIKVLVDPDSAPLLQGVQIDYVETLQASGFSITNPNAVKGCGCGRSFQAGEGAEDAEGAAGGGCGCGGH